MSTDDKAQPECSWPPSWSMEQGGDEACDFAWLVALTEGSNMCLEQLSSWCVHPSCGAVVSFVGTTRDHFHGKRVVHLEYESYHAMAMKEMGRVLRAAQSRFPDLRRAALVHRLGHVPVCEASVIVVVSTPHRREALDASGWILEELKRVVPIWKREAYADGDAVWKGECQGCKRHAETMAMGDSAAGDEGAADSGSPITQAAAPSHTHEAGM
jgi:molybdopterin synthase catalytic subunit